MCQHTCMRRDKLVYVYISIRPKKHGQKLLCFQIITIAKKNVRTLEDESLTEVNEENARTEARLEAY